jgi:WD40 repeat protein
LPGQSGHSTLSESGREYWHSVARIGIQVAEALAYANSQGILHRDIKPSNLLLDTDGIVWITDFGLAKTTDGDDLTHTGDVVGTFRYMAPERFEGQADARSDLYALGLTLYELLTLQPAFKASDRNKLIDQAMHEEPPRPRKLNPAVPRDLETIVLKAVAKDPAHRYQAATELAADLKRFVEDRPIRARQVSVRERFWRWCRRNPIVASLTAALVLVFLAGFAGVAWKWREAERQKDIAAAQREIALEQAERSRRLLYGADMSLALQAWQGGDTGRAQTLLERQWPEAGQEDLRGFEWRYLWRLCQDSSQQTLRGHRSGFAPANMLAEGGVTTVAFSPGGQTLVTSGSDHSVRIWDVAAQRHVKLLGYRVGSVAFAADGKTLAIVEPVSRAVRLWDVAARCERATFQHSSRVRAAAFSPDSKLLATGCEDGTVRIWDVASQQEVVTFRGDPAGGPISVVFSPDGKTLASAGNITVRLWDVVAQREISTLQGHTAWITSLAFSPDGKTLASASNDTTVRLWDPSTGQEVRILRGTSTTLSSVAFSPDSKTLATGGGDGTVRVWDAVKKEVVALLRGHLVPVTAVAFAPDGRSLVSGSQDGSVKVWDIADRPDPNVLTGHRGFLSSVRISPDGKTLAVVDFDNQTVKLWDLASRQQVGFPKGHKGQPVHVRFVRDGQTLATSATDKTVRIWGVATQEQVDEFPNAGNPATFSPDGKLLAGSMEGATILVWDAATKRKVTELPPGRRVEFSPDGKLLAASLGNTVRLRDVATWQSVATLTEHTADVNIFAFAPDGRTLATGDFDGTLRLWDVAQKRQVACRKGHTSQIASVLFSPDGRRVATSSWDSTVKLWDIAPLQEVATLTGHTGPVISIDFSPDGNTLASASADATVRLWQAPPLPATRPEPAEAPSVPPPVETIHLFPLDPKGPPRPS